MTRLKFQDFVTIDFEASSLSTESWPVEIGLSWIDAEGAPKSWSSLIRPHESWILGDWSEASAAVHGIALADLSAAPPAETVAREALQIIGRRHLVSDAPEFEIRWIDRLFALLGLGGRLNCYDFDAVSAEFFPGPALDHVYERLERLKSPHRAGPDSLRLVKAWVHGQRHCDDLPAP